MKIEKDNSISISGFNGIGQSPLDEFSDALGVNLAIPGILSAEYKPTELIRTKSAVEFSIPVLGQDYFTLSTPDTTLHKKAVLLTTTGTLPAPLTTGTFYYLWDINGNGENFRFCADLKDVGSSYINLTDNGTGTHSFTEVTPEEIAGYTFDSELNLYLLDNKQRVWFSKSTYDYQTFYLLDGNTSSGSGNGIIYYAGYILVFANAKIDALAAIGDVDDTLSWTNDFVSATSVTNNAVYPKKGAVPFYSQYDNAIYFYNGSSSFDTSRVRVAFIEENVGSTFDPTNSSTFSIVPNAIELPNNYGLGYVQSINELGNILILGTGHNIIYFWDRKSILPSAALEMPEKNTPAIIVSGGNTYAFNGYNGKFYSISQQEYGEIFSIPNHLFDKKYTADLGLSNTIKIDYVDVKLFIEEILMSIEVEGKAYIMSYNLKTKNLVKKYISSLGETLTTGSSKGRIYQIITLDKTITFNNNILLSTKKESSPDVWIIEGLQYRAGDNQYHNVYDNDTAYITTGLINYGELYDKKTVSELQVSFLRELTEGQGIKVYYRRNDNGAWTLLKTVDYATYGAIKDIKLEAPITDIVDIEFKIIINGYNGSTTGTSPYLKYIRLIP